MSLFSSLLVAIVSMGSISFAQLPQFQDPSFPPEVPFMDLHNTVNGYAWVFAGTDNNGCNSCGGYNPNFQCGPQSAGQRMKSRQPGTNNNDYTYECRPITLGSGQDLRMVQNLPWNGPQFFSNLLREWRWVFLGMDRNGCNECTRYVNLQSRLCGPAIEGLKMARHKANTQNDDFKFQCVRTQ